MLDALGVEEEHDMPAWLDALREAGLLGLPFLWTADGDIVESATSAAHRGATRADRGHLRRARGRAALRRRAVAVPPLETPPADPPGA